MGPELGRMVSVRSRRIGFMEARMPEEVAGVVYPADKA
jgi:hypothetical protein